MYYFHFTLTVVVFMCLSVSCNGYMVYSNFSYINFVQFSAQEETMEESLL